MNNSTLSFAFAIYPGRFHVSVGNSSILISALSGNRLKLVFILLRSVVCLSCTLQPHINHHSKKRPVPKTSLGAEYSRFYGAPSVVNSKIHTVVRKIKELSLQSTTGRFIFYHWEVLKFARRLCSFSCHSSVFYHWIHQTHCFTFIGIINLPFEVVHITFIFLRLPLSRQNNTTLHIRVGSITCSCSGGCVATVGHWGKWPRP